MTKSAIKLSSYSLSMQGHYTFAAKAATEDYRL